jgi:hypothetical protein
MRVSFGMANKLTMHVNPTGICLLDDRSLAAHFRKEKVLFTSLNYRPSLHFHLELENRIFCLLELAKPEIRPF